MDAGEPVHVLRIASAIELRFKSSALPEDA